MLIQKLSSACIICNGTVSYSGPIQFHCCIYCRLIVLLLFGPFFQCVKRMNDSKWTFIYWTKQFPSIVVVVVVVDSVLGLVKFLRYYSHHHLLTIAMSYPFNYILCFDFFSFLSCLSLESELFNAIRLHKLSLQSVLFLNCFFILFLGFSISYI